MSIKKEGVTTISSYGVGGIVGYSGGYPTDNTVKVIYDCNITAVIESEYSAVGIAGLIERYTITNSTFTCTIHCESSDVLIGFNRFLS